MLPATALLELAVSPAGALPFGLGLSSACAILNAAFQAPCSLSARRLVVSLDIAGAGRVTIGSQEGVRYVVAQLCHIGPPALIDARRGRHKSPGAGKAAIRLLGQRSLRLPPSKPPAFNTAVLASPPSGQVPSYGVHPARLDAALHLSALAGLTGKGGAVRVPVALSAHSVPRPTPCGFSPEYEAVSVKVGSRGRSLPCEEDREDGAAAPSVLAAYAVLYSLCTTALTEPPSTPLCLLHRCCATPGWHHRQTQVW